jgi:hypothetical protein
MSTSHPASVRDLAQSYNGIADFCESKVLFR